MDFKRILNWNEKRKLMNFNLSLEFYMLMEELMEFAGYERYAAKAMARRLRSFFDEDLNNAKDNVLEGNIDLTELVDALGDLIVIATGAIYKLGYDPEKVLEVIMNANDKKGSQKNDLGKIIKDNSFEEPDLSSCKLKRE